MEVRWLAVEENSVSRRRVDVLDPDFWFVFPFLIPKLELIPILRLVHRSRPAQQPANDTPDPGGSRQTRLQL